MEKVSREVAESEFGRFCSMLEAYSDADSLNSDDDRQEFNDNRERFVSAVMRGSLVVDESGEVTYTAKNGLELHFSEPTAGQIVAVDRHKKDHNAAKQIALIAALSGKTEREIGQLVQRDMRVLNAIVAGFF
jgi:hypothetical protein